MSEFFQFIRESFGHALPILLAAGFAGAILVERAHALYKRYPIANLEGFFERLRELVMSGRLADAVAFCDGLGPKPVAQVAKQALLRANQPEPLIEDGVELAVGKAAQEIQSRTSLLAMVANVATLLGLFGTIAGLIHAFRAAGAADAQQKAVLLASGISQAMNATLLGLGVAIPCMVGFGFLMSRTNRLIAQLDQSAIQTLDLLRQRLYSAEQQALGGDGAASRMAEAR